MKKNPNQFWGLPGTFRFSALNHDFTIAFIGRTVSFGSVRCSDVTGFFFLLELNWATRDRDQRPLRPPVPHYHPVDINQSINQVGGRVPRRNGRSYIFHAVSNCIVEPANLNWNQRRNFPRCAPIIGNSIFHPKIVGGGGGGGGEMGGVARFLVKEEKKTR